MRIDESERWLGVAIESPADTLGGHIMHVLGRIPAAGERVTLAGGVDIEVERVTANTIVSLLVKPATAPAERGDG
jgi:CBS domain containing-hemolysin-like protein